MRIKSGDIFEAYLTNNKKQFFQFIFKNENEMGGELIRAFDIEVDKNVHININEILARPIKFYAHTMVSHGVKQGFWNKIGNMAIEKTFVEPLFRGTDDVFSVTKKSYNWYIREGSKITSIGELADKYKKLPLTGITPCHGIIRQLETGWDGFKKPE